MRVYYTRAFDRNFVHSVFCRDLDAYNLFFELHQHLDVQIVRIDQ